MDRMNKVISPETYGQADFYNTMHEMLDRAGPIDPLRRTLKDSAVLYGLFAAVSTACMFAAGYFDTLSQAVSADHNYLRMFQGTIATCNVLLTSFLSLVGRYQSYSDLADFQKGVSQEDVIARADPQKKKSRIEHTFNRAMKKTFDINADVSIFLCGVMFCSGVFSGQWGEAVSALCLMPAYWVQKFPDKYANSSAIDPEAEEAKKKTRYHSFMYACERAVQKGIGSVPFVRKMPPLMLGSTITLVRLLPMASNAAYNVFFVPQKIAPGLFQLAQFGFSAIMLAYKSNAPKGGIGRFDGSLLSPNTPDALNITESLLRGRIATAFKSRQPYG